MSYYMKLLTCNMRIIVHTSLCTNNNACNALTRKDKGSALRDFIDIIPLERLVIETDAPYLGFR